MYAAFYKGTRPGIQGNFNRICRWWLRGDFSHTELIFSDGMSASASFIDGGVRIKYIDYDDERWAIYPVYGDEKKAKNFIRNLIGKKFDLLGLLGHALPHKPQKNDKWFCSELVLAALLVANELPFNDAFRADPCNLEAAIRMGAFLDKKSST